MMQNIIEDYLSGIGVVDLAQKNNVHRTTIQRYLKKHNIPLRKKTPKNKYNITFFNTYTTESCYWAGFISADGCVRSGRDTLQIKLSIVDYNHLLKFKEAISFTGDVKIYGDACSISLSGKWVVDSLNDVFDIYPRKTPTIDIPKNIPTCMIPHYVRGYFDGDGCITYTSCLTVSFASGSHDMLHSLTNIFYDIGVRLKSRNDTPPINSGCQISYSGKNAIKILRWLYYESDDHTRMCRKYDKYLDI